MEDRGEYDRVFDEFCAALKASQEPDLCSHWLSYTGASERCHNLMLELAEHQLFHDVFKADRPGRQRLEDFRRVVQELSAEDLIELLIRAQDYERRRLEQLLVDRTDQPPAPEAEHPHIPGYIDWRLLPGKDRLAKIFAATNVRLKRQVAVKIICEVRNLGQWGLTDRVQDLVSAAAGAYPGMRYLRA
jgi:hypothetical protein